MNAPASFWTVVTVLLGIAGAWAVFQIPNIDPASAKMAAGYILGIATGLPVNILPTNKPNPPVS